MPRGVPVRVVQVAAGQKGKAILDGGGTLPFVLVVLGIFLQRLDDDLLLVV